MIPNANDADLSKLGIDSKYYLFYQAWKELTDRRTIDSYQYRLMNTLNILNELNTVIGLRLSGVYASNHNVDECRCEAVGIVKRDPVLKKHNKSLWCSLVSHLSKKAETSAQLRALLYQVKYSYEMIAPWYIEKLIEELEQDIESKNSSGVTFKTSSLISCCAASGWSTPALNRLVDILRDSRRDPEKWEQFRGIVLSPPTHSYRVYIPLIVNFHSSKTDRGQLIKTLYGELHDFGIEVIACKEAIEDDPLLGSCKLPMAKKLMRFDCSAFDQYSACYKALDECSSAMSYFSFYNYIEPWDMENSACFVTEPGKDFSARLSPRDLFQRYDSLQTDNKIFKSSKRVFEQSDTPIAKKLVATYAYANMSKAASSQEERFMNLWVALESLCRGDVYENIISNVLETVPPVLCTRYIYRLCRNFIEDCMRCGVDLSFPGDSCSFDRKASWEDRVRGIIEVVKDERRYLELEARCGVNSLLGYRCHEIREMLSSRDATIARIETHYGTVRRQLGRLYRVRNGIAHTGSTSVDSLAIFTEHLNSYLTSFVSEVVLAADSMDAQSTEVVFEALKDNYKTFLDIAKQAGQADAELVLRGVFETGQIHLIC